MTEYLFKNFEMLDPEHDELRGGYELLVEGDRIREVSAKPIKAASAAVIDCGRRTLMPGLIDSHVHVVLSEVSIPRLENVPEARLLCLNGYVSIDCACHAIPPRKFLSVPQKATC